MEVLTGILTPTRDTRYTQTISPIECPARPFTHPTPPTIVVIESIDGRGINGRSLNGHNRDGFTNSNTNGNFKNRKNKIGHNALVNMPKKNLK